MPLIRWLKGFFEMQAPQSMTRLLALCCVLIAAAYIAVARKDTSPAVVAALIGGGAVALTVRSKAGSPPAGS